MSVAETLHKQKTDVLLDGNFVPDIAESPTPRGVVPARFHVCFFFFFEHRAARRTAPSSGTVVGANLHSGRNPQDTDRSLVGAATGFAWDDESQAFQYVGTSSKMTQTFRVQLETSEEAV